MLGLISFIHHMMVVRSLHGSGRADDVVAVIAAIIVVVVLVVSQSGGDGQTSMTTRRRPMSAVVTHLATVYAVWWPTLLVGYAVHRDVDLSSGQLVGAALIGRHASAVVAPGSGTMLALVLVMGIALDLVPSAGARLVDRLARLGVLKPVRWRVSSALVWSAAGTTLFSGPALDLVARQHVERVTLDSNGRATALVGPLTTTFIWSLIVAVAVGLVFSVAWSTLHRRLVSARWTAPSYRLLAAGTLASAFLVRLVTLLTVAPTRTDGGDPLFYHTTANLLARGFGFPEPLNFIAHQRFIPSALHGPLYPVVLSASSRLGGTTWFDHKFLSLLIGTALVGMVGLVARKVSPPENAAGISLLAMLLAAIYPNLWLVDGVMFPEGLMAVCTMGVVYSAYRWRGTPQARWALAMGALVGLAALARGEGLLLSVLLIVPWIMLRREMPLTRRIGQIAVAALACLVVIAPWAVRNARSFETFVPLSTNGNELFVYANCDATYSGKFLGFWLYQCQEDLRAAGLDATGDEAEKSLYWRQQGLDYARDNASDLPRVVAARIGRQWELFRPWQNADFAPIEGRNKGAARAGLAMYYALAAASVYGAVLIRRRRAGLLPLGALFVNVTLTAAYAYGTTRFRVPAEPALCVLGAVGSYPLFARLRHRWRLDDRHSDDERVGGVDTHESFVTGADVRLAGAFRRSAVRSWVSVATVLSSVAVALPALYRATGSTMEEAFMLVFPERVMRGDIANVDFLHLYGPGSLHALASWYRIFGVSLAAERTFGLLQHLAIIIGLVVITRPWGRIVSTVVGVVATVFVLAPIGLQALAWNGAVGLALWSVIFAIRARHRLLAGRSTTRSWVISGLLAGLALTFRPDAVLALALCAVFVLWRQPRRTIATCAAGLIVGLTSLWVHLVQAGPAAVVRGIILDPVFHLRAGRELPRPPSLDHLDGALQVIGEKFGPWWGVPHLGAAKQLFIWFFLLPVVAFAVLGVAVLARRRGSPRAITLMAGALFGVGLLPQALQRPDSAHFLWVSCISWPLLIAALIEFTRLREPRTHPHARLAIAVAIIGVLMLIATPYYTLRTYLDVAQRSLRGDTPVLEVSRNGRYFYLGDTRPWLATREVIADLDAKATPGERLLVGPVDLRQTAYSDVMFYYLFPDLTPATYFIEMDPGLANTAGSRLSDDVRSADWLILTRFWSGWIEPNTSTVFGPDEPNQVVEQNFCLEGSYQHDVLRLYHRCSDGDSTGPYDAPYDPRYDYAVEVRVPVPARPDGTCTPTCDGSPNPDYAGIDTSVIE